MVGYIELQLASIYHRIGVPCKCYQCADEGMSTANSDGLRGVDTRDPVASERSFRMKTFAFCTLTFGTLSFCLRHNGGTSSYNTESHLAVVAMT